MKKLISTSLMLCLTMVCLAQRIDISFSNAQEAQTHEPDYIEWKIPHSPSSSLTLDNGMEITVSAAGNATTLRDQWHKNTCNKGRDTEQVGLRLLGDGVAAFIAQGDNTPTSTDTPTAMEVKVTGLTAGHHSVMAYHVWKDPKKGDMPKIQVELKVNDGSYEVRQTNVDYANVQQTPENLKMADAPFSYVDFDVAEGDIIYIRYASVVESGKTYQTTNVMLNGLLFDTSPFVAQDPIPTSRDYHLDAAGGSYTLKWTPGPTAQKHRLYYGTDEATVANSTTHQYEGSDTYYNIRGLNSWTRYYWRVDEVDADGHVHKGNVWSFQPRQLAFPEAEGYGRFARGGRGGVVYHVTSLSGGNEPGTLLYGLTQMDEPRYIVFDVSGIIELDFDSHFTKPYAYIAGQTAPGKGICIKASNINIGSDVIARYVRFKRGLGVYGENTGNAMGMSGANHAIVDHCTAAWGTDETVSGRGAKNISFQYSGIFEALGITGHKNYSDGTNHGYAATIDGQIGSWHHNLLLNCEGRNWSMGGGMDANNIPIGGLDLFNNVCYNWHNRTTDGNCHMVNFVGNYYKMGADTKHKKLFTQQFESAINPAGTDQAYVSGNIRENKDHTKTQDKKGDTYDASGNIPTSYDYLVSGPLFESYANIHSAEDAMKIVTSYAGATMPMRDDQHQRVVRETLDGTWTYKGSKSGIKGEIDNEADIADAENGGWEVWPEEHRAADYDTDQDGMPDWWERITGSNPSVADHNEGLEPDGWTLLDDFLEFMAHPYLVLAPGETKTLDLKPYFIGFYGQNGQNVTPTYTVSVTEGSATATVADGVLTAKGGATGDVTTLSVTVNDGSTTFTQRFGIAVTADATAVPTVWTDADIVSREFFTLDGRQVSMKGGQASSNGCQMPALNRHQVYLMRVTDRQGRQQTLRIMAN
jgi:hypothetical protein